MITRIILYATLGMVLHYVGLDYDQVGFWLILALFWASEHTTRHETHEHSFIQGMITYINMTDTEQLNLRNKIKEIDNNG